MLSPVVTTAPRASARALLPKEHGLWCWVGAPLLGAVTLAPSGGATLAGLSVLALFGAGNAARAEQGRLAGGAAAASAALGLAAVPLLDAPRLWLAALGALVVGGAVIVEAAGRAVGRKVRGHTAYELGAIGGFGAAGAAVAVAAGAPASTSAAAALTLATWQLLGLTWVRRELARVLPGREPWAAGPLVAGAAALGNAAIAALVAAPLLGALPALYALRIATTRPATSGRDARRIGLSEAAWAGVATVLASTLAGGAP